MKMLPVTKLQFLKNNTMSQFLCSFKLKQWLRLIMFGCVLFTTSGMVFSQSRALTKAENAFNAGEYYLAIDLYKDAYGSLQDKTN